MGGLFESPHLDKVTTFNYVHYLLFDLHLYLFLQANEEQITYYSRMTLTTRSCTKKRILQFTFKWDLKC